MKMLIFIVLVFSVIGCIPSSRKSSYENYTNKNYKLNETQTVTIGSPILGIESGIRIIGLPQYKSGTYQELIYVGKDNNTINIDYREYKAEKDGYFIKDGFTQHLKYDISKDKIIKYKDIQIEIIEAGNDLKCKVLN